MSSENIRELLKQEIVNGSKKIYAKGLVVFGEGNISARIPGSDEFFITPTLNNYETITTNDIVHMNFNGTKLSAGKSASSEYRLHVALYNDRPRVNYIVHTHSPYASMFSIVRKEIPVLFEEMVIFLGGNIPVSDFGRANTDEISSTALAGMKSKNAVLMANHGMLAVGRTMENTVKTAERVEKMARVYWGALQIGTVNTIEATACGQFKAKFDEKFATHNEDHVECL